MDLHQMLRALANHTGHELGKRTFDSRLLTQKCTYLIQQLGLLERGFHFGFYVKGVYSTDLARTYYTWDPITPQGNEQAELTGPLIIVRDALDRGPLFMEALTSIIMIGQKNPAAPPSTIRAQVLAVKPYVGAQIDDAIVEWQNNFQAKPA